MKFLRLFFSPPGTSVQDRYGNDWVKNANYLWNDPQGGLRGIGTRQLLKHGPLKELK